MSRPSSRNKPAALCSVFRGAVIGVVPGLAPVELFGSAGFTLATSTGPSGRSQSEDRAGRRVLWWTDHAGLVIDRWLNPFNGLQVEPLHEWLDPVFVPAGAGTTTTGDDEPGWSVTSALTALRADVYRAEVAPGVLHSAVHRFGDSSVHILPWLPWMLMGDHPGHMVVHMCTQEMVGGFEAIPQWMRDRVRTERPEFAFPPTSTPGGSADDSWTRYAAERQPALQQQRRADAKPRGELTR